MMDRENTLILCCASLRYHLDAAQQKMGADYPVRELDWACHKEPALLRETLLQTMAALPPHITTVLSCVCDCGGVWEGIKLPCRTVLPRMDDCVTMLLQTDDTLHPDVKQEGHIYFRDGDRGEHSVAAFKDEICRRYGMEIGTSIFGGFMQGYTHADMVDTGVYDCYDEAFVAEMQQCADLIRCDLDYVTGSNRVLENLVSGHWETQFLVCETGHVITERDFFPEGQAAVRRVLY